MVNIDVKYEAWKNKLLDLGKRNRLLNYKDTARSNVKIEYPECGSLYNMFVKEENALVFPVEYDEENSEIEYVSNVKTNKNTSDLQKALRNLRNKAKTAIEEQGVNVLYLSFGFLKWTESEGSNQIFTSPLVLVPVTLTIESIKSPYILTLYEDEIVVNPTLVYKLENDFGITLPIFDENEDVDDFLEEVKRSITLKNWSVTKDVGLSLLSFLKINMYSDLNKHKESIVANPIVRVISGDPSAITRIPDEMIDFDFDKQMKPSDVFQVVDADASQQDAIMMAKKGVSFVLQGPPGTGKSQTITNIIAESLAYGKKVLFVSEKMAALDVVHRRLAGAGLDDFCLVLHSHKANKRNVLDQLGKVLDLSQKKVTLTDEAYQKLNVLQADKDKLNDYAEQVYEIIEPLGKSIYEVNGIIANLDSYDDYIFAISDIRNVTKEQYNKFYRGKNIQMTFQREVNILYMLKKNEYYCFIHKAKKGNLSILNGGAMKKLEHQDIHYYFDNMDIMVSMIEKPLKKFTMFQKSIADIIKKIGGSGTIHGCIIDIDFYNHIYVNPIDLSITGYWAYDTINKMVYSSIPNLLKNRCPKIFSEYKKIYKNNRKNPLVIRRNKNNISSEIYLETDIYKTSREMKKMQKLNSHILTFWYDNIVKESSHIYIE